MQRLKHDLLSLDAALKDFGNKNSRCVPDVPSWKYPELTAAAVDVKRCLETSAEDGLDLLVLELLHDRSQFLVQSVLRSPPFSSAGKSVPLSLGTASRRLLKAVEEETTHRGQQQQQQQQQQQSQQHPPPNQAPPPRNQAPPPRSVAVQTTATCLSLCAHCVELQTAMQTADRLTAHALAACGHSPPGNAPPTAPPPGAGKVGVVDRKAWLTALEGNIQQMIRLHGDLVEHCSLLADRTKELQQQLKTSQVAMVTREEEAAQVAADYQARLKNAEQENARLLGCHGDALRGREEQVRQVRQEVEEQQSQVRGLLEARQQLVTSLADKTRRTTSLESEVQQLSAEVKSLEEKAASRDWQLEDSRTALQDQQEKVEQFKQLLSSKDQHASSLVLRLKSLQDKHASIIAMMDELGQEKERLSAQLQTALVECQRGRLEQEALSTQIHQLQTELVRQKGESAKAAAEVDRCSSRLSDRATAEREARAQLDRVHRELAEAQHQCRLLMDYPSFNPFANGSSSGGEGEGEGLGASDSRHHISANTVRILLLEEQNKDLRIHLLPPPRSSEGGSGRGLYSSEGSGRGLHSSSEGGGSGGTKLWQPKLFATASAQRCPSSGRPSGPAPSASSCQTEPELRPQGSARYKGHLGRLATALRSSQESHDRKYTPSLESHDRKYTPSLESHDRKYTPSLESHDRKYMPSLESHDRKYTPSLESPDGKYTAAESSQSVPVSLSPGHQHAWS